MSTYLVTGAKGFVGTALTRRLATSGHVVHGVDVGDSLSGLIPEVDGVFHLAGHASAGEFEKHHSFLDADVGAFVDVCVMALAHKKPVVCVSSAFSLNPVTLYGLSRSFMEQLAWFFARRGLDIHVARFFNIYGPGQENAVTYAGTFIVDTIKAMLKAPSACPIRGSMCLRDFVFIEDVLDDLETIMDGPGDKRVWDVGSGVLVSLQGAADIMARIIGLPYRPEGDMMPDEVPPYFRAARISDGLRRTELEDGLAKTISHMRTTELAVI